MRDHPSPNFGERREGAKPDLIVIHYTAMASAAEALARLSDPVAEVSAHYLIGEDGEVWSLVPEEARAWHAGAGGWGGVTDVNSRSIGIELANGGAAPFSARQIAALEALLADIVLRWSIPLERVIGHSDMAPERKIDPGARFDWRRLALAGLSVWPAEGEAEVDPVRFAGMARSFGYREAKIDVLLAAVRLRFRPWAKGPLDARDMGIVADLARRFPVDASGAQV
ncbi:MAG: N-acetylmuramoyl-L-alanine amidase [Cereibacter sphaeroides]|uniref:N-acetylmuramoyl-L-alanine amidase n=1 Tax=Cereibacter sphaeroides TaxID=1063 RepID=A0A2W5SAK7_CERSP|nr:MAG: N-acetylmuramoyl-L-alanine amidase [Cereibacter sphaeroides]